MLAQEPVRERLYEPAAGTLIGLLDEMRSTPTPVGVEEKSRSVALCYLLYRARGITAGLDRHSPSAVVSAEPTWLRCTR